MKAKKAHRLPICAQSLIDWCWTQWLIQTKICSENCYIDPRFSLLLQLLRVGAVWSVQVLHTYVHTLKNHQIIQYNERTIMPQLRSALWVLDFLVKFHVTLYICTAYMCIIVKQSIFVYIVIFCFYLIFAINCSVECEPLKV